MTNYYWNENPMKIDGVYPTILLIGGSLTNNLGPIVASIVREALRLYGADLAAVFLSGGGNDFAYRLEHGRPRQMITVGSTARACVGSRPAIAGTAGRAA